MKRLGEIKFGTFLGMDRLRKTPAIEPSDEEFDIVNPGKKGQKVRTWDSYMDLDTFERGKLRALFGRGKVGDGKGKGKEWGDEIPLGLPRREKDSHEFAPPPPYYVNSSAAAGPSFRRVDGHHALGDSKTRVISMSGQDSLDAPTSPDTDPRPRTLRPPPRTHRAPASDSCVRPLQRAGPGMDSDEFRMVRFDDVYADFSTRGMSGRMERLDRGKSLPDVPYSPVFGTLSLGHGDEGETRRAEHGWI